MEMEDVTRVHAIDLLSFSLPWTERTYRFEVAENANASPWVAEVVRPDGIREIAAMVVNWIILDEAHVATLAVHPDYRRQGLAQRLLAHSLLEAWQRGARSALLEVRRGNFGAQNLYQRFGFAIVGVRPRYYKDNNEDALLMTLERLNPQQLKSLEQAAHVPDTGASSGGGSGWM
jgi:ribosomal-protein-alanine N-acetyltransferase